MGWKLKWILIVGQYILLFVCVFAYLYFVGVGSPITALALVLLCLIDIAWHEYKKSRGIIRMFGFNPGWGPTLLFTTKKARDYALEEEKRMQEELEEAERDPDIEWRLVKTTMSQAEKDALPELDDPEWW